MPQLKRHVMNLDPSVILAPDAAGLDQAADLLRAGQLVAFPTETVYGLGGSARDDGAVAAIFDAKGRPRFNPLISHVADLAGAEALAELTPDAHKLAEAFWPGPLTLVLPTREGAGLSPLVTAGHASVAVRVPAHPVARALLRAFGGPVAAPSANPSGKVSSTTAEHVAHGLGGRIGAIVDGGPCEVGVESTIISCLDGGPRLLRAGGLPREAIEAVLGRAIETGVAGTAPIAPGMLASHYAPEGLIRLNAKAREPGETFVGFGPTEGADLTLSATGDLREAAARLFSVLHQLNELGASHIAFAPVPETGLGLAINDRLRRAAAPRQ